MLLDKWGGVFENIGVHECWIQRGVGVFDKIGVGGFDKGVGIFFTRGGISGVCQAFDKPTQAFGTNSSELENNTVAVLSVVARSLTLSAMGLERKELSRTGGDYSVRHTEQPGELGYHKVQ